MEAQTRNKTPEKRQYWEGRNVLAVNDSHKVTYSKCNVLVIKRGIWNMDLMTTNKEAGPYDVHICSGFVIMLNL